MFTTESLKGKPTYPRAINPYLQDTQVFYAYVLTTVIPHSCGVCWFLAKYEWEMIREK